MNITPLTVRRITGGSMEPTFTQGQIIVASHWWWRLVPGDVVILRHNRLEKIKRIRQIRDDVMWVVGDNARASTDSRHFGMVPVDAVVAKVLFGL